MTGTSSSTDRYAVADVARDAIPYRFLANGWGPGFSSHSVRWEGTSFVVENLSGSASGGQAAAYPSTFCGRYSDSVVPACGLPAAIASLASLPTGWHWASNGNTGAYSAAYDIWLGNGTQVLGYLMLWLRDSPGYTPYGSIIAQSIAIEGQPFNVWSGTLNGVPVITYARAEGQDVLDFEFDALEVISDARNRGLPAVTHVNAVAVGFEIFSGPITNLASLDFYVDALP